MEADDDEKFAFQKYIDEVRATIQTSFIQRRIEEGSSKENLSEEVQDLAQEISLKEDQLNGLTEMGNYLIDKQIQNEQDMQENIRHLENQIADQEMDIEFQKQSVTQYKKLYNEGVEKNQQILEQMMNVENDLEKANFELKTKDETIQSLSKNRISQDKIKANDQRKIDDQQQQHIQENERLQKQISDQKQLVKTIRKEMISLENTNRKLQDQVEKANSDFRYEQSKQSKIQQHTEELEKTIQNQENQLSEQSNKILDLNKKITELKQSTSSQSKIIYESLHTQGNRGGMVTEAEVMHTQENEIIQQRFQENFGNLLCEIEDLGVNYQDSARGSKVEGNYEFQVQSLPVQNNNINTNNNTNTNMFLKKSTNNMTDNNHTNLFVNNQILEEKESVCDDSQQEDSFSPNHKNSYKKQQDELINAQSPIQTQQNNDDQQEKIRKQSSDSKKSQKNDNDQIILNKSQELNSSIEFQASPIKSVPQSQSPLKVHINNNNSNYQQQQFQSTDFNLKHSLQLIRQRQSSQQLNKTGQDTQKLQDLIHRKRHQPKHTQSMLSSSSIIQAEMDQSTDNNNQNNITNKQLQQQQNQKPEKKTLVPKKRDPYEEFFNLTAQCVKLNSEFMDDILDIDTSEYYKQVRQQCIPYHLWQKYILESLMHERDRLLLEQSDSDDSNED